MRRTAKSRHQSREKQVVAWLPIDSRILPSIISFGHVRGVARIFLFIELLTSTLVVIGTLVLLVLSLVA